MSDVEKPLGDAVVQNADDMAFQRREWFVQRLGQLLLALVVLLALLGVLGGSGSLNHTVASSPDRSLSIEYDRVLRQAAPTTLRVTVGSQGAQWCRISRAWFDRVRIERILPTPIAFVVEGDALVLRFSDALEPGSTVTIDVAPNSPGRLSGWAAVEHHPPAVFKSLVLL